MLKHVFILVAIIGLNGCGNTSNEPLLDNSALLKNELGYYGADAIFASQRLLNEWELSVGANSAQRLRFRSDGTLSLRDERIGHGRFGVNAEGTQLLYTDQRYASLRMLLSLKTVRDDGCIEASLENQNSTVDAVDALMCPVGTRMDALDNGVNLFNPLSAAGYYGDNVNFMQSILSGEWKRYRVDANGSVSALGIYHYRFDSDGSVTVTGGDTGVALETYYGVNEDATELYLKDDVVFFKVIKNETEQCVLVKQILHDTNVSANSDYLFCKL